MRCAGHLSFTLLIVYNAFNPINGSKVKEVNAIIVIADQDPENQATMQKNFRVRVNMVLLKACLLEKPMISSEIRIGTSSVNSYEEIGLAILPETFEPYS